MTRFPVRRGAAALCAGVALCFLTGAAAIAAKPATHAAYGVRELGTLGGTSAGANSINDLRWASGSSTITGNTAQHAALWFHHEVFDLGTLGGPNSAVDWPVKNNRGRVVGNAETANADPLGENFCRFGTGHTCLGFSWYQGVMSPLPTLGGNNGYAAGENDNDEAVGWAEDTTQDGTCDLPQVLQYEGVVWSPALQIVEQLPPLPMDSDGAAVAINESGTVVGISGPCADADGGGAMHAVMWQNGVPTNLGNFGGTILNTADSINSAGDIVGFSTLPGNAVFHAFLWTPSNGITDLGTLPGDAISEALSINDSGQIVGGSCDATGNCRAVIWQNGTITDLNTLIAPQSPLFLNFAGDITNDGVIAGLAFDQGNGTSPAYIATPHGGQIRARPGHRVMLPARVRAMLRRFALHHAGPV